MSQATLQLITDFVLYFILDIPLSFGVGVGLWAIGNSAEKRKLKSEAIINLMTYRGDYSNPEFRRALNKISVIFHKDEDVRKEVRQLYEVMNSGDIGSETAKRKVVGLIYNLCKKNGFRGLTEYDIDQAFPETKQEPQEIPEAPLLPTSKLPEVPPDNKG